MRYCAENEIELVGIYEDKEVLMLVVVLFGIWRVMTGAYIMLILVATTAFVMYRQFIILQSFNQTDGEE